MRSKLSGYLALVLCAMKFIGFCILVFGPIETYQFTTPLYELPRSDLYYCIEYNCVHIPTHLARTKSAISDSNVHTSTFW